MRVVISKTRASATRTFLYKTYTINDVAPETLFEFTGSHAGLARSGTVLAAAERTGPAAIPRPLVRRTTVSNRAERPDRERVTDAT